MFSVGEKFLQFDLLATIDLAPGKEFVRITNATFTRKWLIVFAWPMDFTFIYPTEIAEFGRRNKDFLERDAQVLGL
jgi:lipoyl-dependent peroxiredoxin subunit C